MNWEISSDLDTCVQEILRGEIRLQAQIVLNEEPKAYVAQHFDMVALINYF